MVVVFVYTRSGSIDDDVGGLLDDFRRLVDRLCLLDGSHQFVAKVIMS